MNETLIADEYVVSYDLGCIPSPSGADELVIQNERFTYVIFAATAMTGEIAPLIAVVRCEQCGLTRQGYPNDEGLPEHPLYSKGLRDIAVGEVINSSWQAMLETQMDTSARRIWGEHYWKAYKVPVGGKREFHFKHFIFQFKESTFECIAEKLVLESLITITPTQTYRDIVIEVLDRMEG